MMSPAGRILLIKLGAIGDVVMAMAAVRRALGDGAELTWVCGRTIAGLVRRHLPSVSLIEIDEPALLNSGLISGLKAILGANKRLLLKRYDLVATGYRDARYIMLSLSVQAQARRSFAPKTGHYHADEYLSLLGQERWTGNRDPLHPSELLPPHETSGTGLVLAPGGAKNLLREDTLRRYPIEHYVALARMALDRGEKVTIMGAASDEWVRPHFVGLPVHFELGTVSLEEIPLWLRQFRRLITHDSGPMHLGFMSGIPVTALFGPTRADEKVPRNYAQNGSLVIQGGEALSCAPCYDGRDYADCAHQRCLKDLSPVEDWLK